VGALLDYPAQAAERTQEVFTAKREAQRLERQLLVSPAHKTANSALRSICYMLHDLAQKYVPSTPNTFNDYACLTHCTKLLKSMGFRPDISPELDSAVAGLGLEVVHNSFEYRHLRNKIMASLAVIADLTERPAATGSSEYQRGMREGYRRASDIAVMFLEDISGGE
jgi:hypothetical protein